jgi:hypothetical protein
MSMPMIILNNVVAVENVEKLDVDMYVNNSVLVVEGEYTSVEIYSVVGEFVGAFDSESRINLSNLNKGVYLVRVMDGAKSVTKKITL